MDLIAKNVTKTKFTSGFGVEMVSTDDTDARFEVSAFSIDEKLRTKPGDVSDHAGAIDVKK